MTKLFLILSITFVLTLLVQFATSALKNNEKKKVDTTIEVRAGGSINNKLTFSDHLLAHREDEDRSMKMETETQTEMTNTINTPRVRLPRARFFADMNQRGDSEDYNMAPTIYRLPGCHNLERLGGQVKSLSTFDTCLMLYEDKDCLGTVFMVTPTPLNTLGHDVELNGTVKSVSPCVGVAVANNRSR